MKGWLALMFLLVGLCAVGWHYYLSWGRRVIYSADYSGSAYVGMGKVTVDVSPHLIISPKEVGQSFTANFEEWDKYSPTEYDVQIVPEQVGIKYVVGIVRGWEDIPGSGDKYLLIQEGYKSVNTRYRIGFEPSILFGSVRADDTSLLVENTSLMNIRKSPSRVQKYQYPRISDVGFNALSEITVNGDSVVLIPVFSPPDYSKKDSNGVYLVSAMILRRIGGVNTLKSELGPYESND